MTTVKQTHIVPIPAFKDNYIWCIRNENVCTVVDPGDAKPVIEYCEKNNLQLTSILITHHHSDHTGGIKALREAFQGICVFGPDNPKIQGITHVCNDNTVIELNDICVYLNVMKTPGHTLDHICFFNEDVVFCGDTLFSAGCGRMFEGTPEVFLHSLNKLSSLNNNTKVYCTHEYTLANLDFARFVEPSNNNIVKYTHWAEQQRQENLPTLPTDIGTQKAINPFFRCEETDIVNFLKKNRNFVVKSPVDTFALLRELKDNF